MNKPVQVTLSDQAASFLSRELESGRFDTVDEVVEAGLKMLEDEQLKIERLRELLIESENSGPAEPFDREALMASVRASWAERG
ncbi:type II toxin-antitoxin system ParD family antitoxin [Aliirhizobium smilacinae]|uniref:Type II toxin-antitoxin system ParD family antitoxin n=1 Tax=Aliirhizobium smilacinae TaxID=1395944 RepID=A0A5C4XS99_9HYPH|nr:type II toxin-antitoxin system ParD family antitoxin [Rhizobium smilacinae]TNM65931.1 type II toxin-antitoxin system ParD family antitoxin [Rhizobium smilacinae]